MSSARKRERSRPESRGLCSECGEEAIVVERPAAYRYVAGGLPHVILAGGVEVERCEACGAEGLSILRIGQLHEALAFALATQPKRLLPSEAKFLRKYLGHSTSDLASLMGVSPETVSRWESEKSAQPIGPPTERLLRLMVLRERPVEEYPTERLAEIDANATAAKTLRVEQTDDGWRAAA